MMEQEKTKYLEFAKNMALWAADIMHKYSKNTDKKIELKEDSSPVTAADKEINALLVEKVKELFPQHGVLGEEESWESSRSMLWVCDPIDGTVPFIMHMPLATFSLALVVDGRPEIAVCYNPSTKEMFWATLGGGAFCGEKLIHVSDRQWGQYTRLLGSSSGASKEPVDHPDIWQSLKKQNTHVTKIPGTVFKGCLVASGAADGRIFVHNGAHDIAAIKLIIEEAGGKVTDLNGKEQRYDRPINGAVMSNGIVHEQLLDLVKQYENLRD